MWVDVDKDDYYSYEVYSQDGNIIIEVLDEREKLWTFNFCKYPNQLYFIDAYKNFIIVEERKPGATVSYWLIQIIEKNDCFTLDAFCVSSTIGTLNYDISFGYKI